MDEMEEFLTVFFQECEERLAELQDCLSQMVDGDFDSETLNAAFRAVHSVKGGAGAFGLDDLVEFTHVFETTMDAVRNDNLDPNAMSPQTIEVKLFDGTSHCVVVEHPLGSPGRRLDAAQRAAKVAQCFQAGDFARDPQHFVDLCMTLPGGAPAIDIIRYLKGEEI